MPDPIDGQEQGAGAPPAEIPDPHGEAALLLVESLIHDLVAQSHLSVGEAVHVAQIAADTQVAISDDRGDPEEPRTAHRYLTAIVRSLSIDDPSQDHDPIPSNLG